LLQQFRRNFHRTRLRGARRPWSLVRRLTGGVVLIALLSFGAQALVLWLWLRPVADDLAGIAAEQAVMAQAALAAVPAAQRPALADRMSSGGVLVTSERPPPGQAITEVPPLPSAQSDGSPAPRDIFIRFQGRPGEDFAATFRLPVEGEDWWLTREYRAARGAVSSTLVVWLVMLAVATVGALLAPLVAWLNKSLVNKVACSPCPKHVTAAPSCVRWCRPSTTWPCR
jgi:hypothetical protein